MEGAFEPVGVAFSGEGALREMRLQYPNEPPNLFEVMAPVSPGAAQLAAYGGRFVNEELAAVYEVLWDGTRLLLRRPGHPSSPLAARFEDAFTDSEIGLIRFSRDDSGRVCGLTVRYGAQALEFQRLPGS